MNRRQNFLTERSYELLSKHYANEERYWRENHLEADSESHELSMKSTLLKDACFKSLLLEYTAGCEPEKMIPLLACLVEKYETRQLLLSKYDGRINIAPLAIDDLLDQYEEFIQVLSLCILLDQPDLLVRFVELFDRAEYFGSDALYEDLLTKVVPGRLDVDTWYHSEYSKLLYAIYADTSDEASTLLEEYCDEWYSSFRQAPWHDLHIGGDTQGYVGYWAFEAAAVAYLYDIDDSKIKHMVYPKDLVEYARSSSSGKSLQGPGRVSANNPCPRTGFWFSSARADSKQFFRQGEIMPEFRGSSWGSTIWYWSGEKES